jgi:hypothetical protein
MRYFDYFCHGKLNIQEYLVTNASGNRTAKPLGLSRALGAYSPDPSGVLVMAVSRLMLQGAPFGPMRPLPD